MISAIKKLNSAYIFGAGRLGKAIKKAFDANNIEFQGFIDNNASGSLRLCDVKDKTANVVVASLNYMYEIETQLKNFGFKNVISFAMLTNMIKELNEFNQSYCYLSEDYLKNKKKYEEVESFFCDEKSLDVFHTLIEYRKTYNTELFCKICDDIQNQYFEPFMPKSDVFVDGGAFDGDTVKRCLEHGFSLSKIYFFEPDLKSMALAKNNLSNINGIEYFSCGLSDKYEVRNFDARGDFGSVLSENGNLQINCVSLDKIVKEDKAFIKLDIEGSEIDAINGAKRLLGNGSPFSICVYHKPSDLWRIPKLIKKINSSYKLYLRHYTTNIFETVLYGYI